MCAMELKMKNKVGNLELAKNERWKSLMSEGPHTKMKDGNL